MKRSKHIGDITITVTDEVKRPWLDRIRNLICSRGGRENYWRFCLAQSLDKWIL